MLPKFILLQVRGNIFLQNETNDTRGWSLVDYSTLHHY